MPTPFYHLFLTETLLNSDNMEPVVVDAIMEEPEAFYFGNTAPDVQSICDISRYDTHFYKVHKPGQKPAEKKFLKKYPALNNKDLPGPNKLFIAGYCCHLQADQVWLDLIFNPYFGLDADWAPIKERAYIHNVFRTWHDLQVFHTIIEPGRKFLSNMQGSDFLPFLDDATLDKWRKYLFEQLNLESSQKTALIFAKRLGIDPEEFIELLESEDRLQNEVFSRVPEYIIEKYITLVVEKNSKFLFKYLTEI